MTEKLRYPSLVDEEHLAWQPQLCPLRAPLRWGPAGAWPGWAPRPGLGVVTSQSAKRRRPRIRPSTQGGRAGPGWPGCGGWALAVTLHGLADLQVLVDVALAPHARDVGVVGYRAHSGRQASMSNQANPMGSDKV